MVYDKDMCKSKLGILMCAFRADRPSEWQMDEFIHHAEDMNNKINELTKQRDELLAALQGMIDIASDSQGVAGYHLNGAVAGWDEFEEWQSACDAIAKAKGAAK